MTFTKLSSFGLIGLIVPVETDTTPRDISMWYLETFGEQGRTQRHTAPPSGGSWEELKACITRSLALHACSMHVHPHHTHTTDPRQGKTTGLLHNRALQKYIASTRSTRTIKIDGFH